MRILLGLIGVLAALVMAPAASANTIIFDGFDGASFRGAKAEFSWTYGAAPDSEFCSLERLGDDENRVEIECDSDVMTGLQHPSPTTRKWVLQGLNVGDGIYTLTVTAGFGAPMPLQVTRTLYIDDTPPTLSLAGPTGLTNDNTIDVTISASDGLVYCAIDPPSFDLEDILAWPTCATGPRPAIADGQHTFVAVAVDEAGNTTSKSLSFTVDTTPPAIELGGIADGSVVPTPYPQYTLGSPDALSIQCYYDNNPQITCQSISVSTVGLGDGPHTMHIVATDLAGNVATKVVSFTVNDSLPEGPTPKSLSLKTGKVKKAGSRIKVALAGAFKVNGDINWATACTGRVTIAVTGKVGGKSKTFRAKGKLKRQGSGCKFNATLKAPKAWRNKRFKTTVTYAGNNQLGSFSVTGTLRLKPR